MWYVISVIIGNETSKGSKLGTNENPFHNGSHFLACLFNK